MAFTELEPMSSPTRPLLPSFFLNIVYPFLEDLTIFMRLSRRRARARRTLAWVVRQCGVSVFIVVEFIFLRACSVESCERIRSLRVRLRRGFGDETFCLTLKS